MPTSEMAVIYLLFRSHPATDDDVAQDLRDHIMPKIAAARTEFTRVVAEGFAKFSIQELYRFEPTTVADAIFFSALHRLRKKRGAVQAFLLQMQTIYWGLVYESYPDRETVPDFRPMDRFIEALEPHIRKLPFAPESAECMHEQ